MIGILVLIGTAIGWAMIGHVATQRVIRWRRQKHLPRPNEAQKRMERIARLEIACGVGLKYGEDALAGVSTRFARRERHLSEYELRSFGGAVERVCWACGQEFKPSAHADWYKRPKGERYPSFSFYGDNSNPDRDPLDETLCPDCLRNARAELDYGVPMPWDK